jgi:DNA-binding protein HU-beta
VQKSLEICGFHIDGAASRRLHSAPPRWGQSFNKLAFSSRKFKGGLKVNKNDLVAAVADSAGLSKADSAKAVDAVFDSISGVLKGGGDVRLVGFGTFSVANRAASEGRNPRTGERIRIPASRQPKFKAGKGLKDAVN